MDIYRAQRQFRTHDQDVAGTSITNNNSQHGSKGSLHNIIGSAAGSGAVAAWLKGVNGITFQINLGMRTGEPCILPFKTFGAATNLGGVNRSIVGLY